MKQLEKVKNWPIEKKRNFSIIVAVFLTLLVIGINYSVNIFWPDDKPVNVYEAQNNPINKLAESFKKNLDIVQPTIDKAFADMQSPSTTAATEQFIKSISSSSLSTSSNVVE